MIKINKAVKAFDGFRALDGVNMHVQKGSIYGLVGPNGAGKTTLMNTLCGIYKAQAGTITVDGQPVYENNEIKKRMVYISDEVFYFHNSTVTSLKSFYKGIYPDFDEALFDELARCFPNIDKKASLRRLSKGMKKQAAFWIAICCQPDVLLLDEPVDGLDPMRHQVWALLMNEVAKRQMTVLVSSHNLRELEDVCDTVGIMNRGKIFMEATLDDLKTALTKYQVSFADETDVKALGLHVLQSKKTGRVYELVVEGDRAAARARLEAAQPLLIDELPLTLEEIFIYELGEADDEIKQMLI